MLTGGGVLVMRARRWLCGRSTDHETGGNQKLALHVGSVGVFGLLAEGLKGGARIVVMGGKVNSAKSMSSRPMTDKS
jgi:hypothetical protein